MLESFLLLGLVKKRMFMLAQLTEKRTASPRVSNCHAEIVPKIWLAMITISDKLDVIIQGLC